MQKIDTKKAIAVVVLALALLGALFYGLLQSGSGGQGATVIVKPANSDDPHYRPDPKFGSAGTN